jgi:hypothetical protein
MLGDLLDLAGLGMNLFGHAESRRNNERQWQAYQAQLKQSQGQFDAQMDTSIQRRVADAKKAGIHPLFAMGASVGASPTLSGGQPPTGSGLTDAIASLAEGLGAIGLNRANAKAATAQARRDEAEAAYIDSQRARLGQELVSRGRDGASVKTYPMPDPTTGAVYGPAEYVAPQIPFSKPGRPGVVAGTRPGTVDVRLPDGSTVNLLDQELGLDEISQVDYIMQRMRHKATPAAQGHVMLGKKLLEQAKRIWRSGASTQRYRRR